MDPYSTQQIDNANPQGFHALLRFVRVVIRHRMILIVSICAAAFLAMIRFNRLPKVYTADTRVMVTRKQSASAQIIGNAKMEQTVLSTYRQLILSDRVLKDSVALMERKPPELVGCTDDSLWPELLRQMISVNQQPTDQTVIISSSSTDPEATVAVIRALALASQKFLADYQKDISVEMIRELEENRKAVQARLEEKENALLAARRSSGDISLTDNGDESHPLTQRVSRLNAELTTVRGKRLELQSALSSAKQLVIGKADLTSALKKLESIVGEKVVASVPGASGTTAETVEALQSDLKSMEAELAAIRPHYGSQHSDVKRRESQIAAQRKRVVEAQTDMRRQIVVGVRDPQVGIWLVNTIHAELASTAQYERSLEIEYASIEEEARDLSDKMAGIQNVAREADTLRELHTSLLTRLNSISIDEGSGGFRVAPLSEPLVPKDASYPVLSSIMVMFCLGGAGMGLGVIYVIDLLDDRLGSPEEVREQLGLSVLGVIRRLPEEEVESCKIYVHDFPQTPHAECFRTLKTGITMSPMDTKCLAVTSTEASEGKTTTTVNLAASFAQTGQRTLLIDADMRRPGLSRLLDVRGQGGLSEVLRAENDISEMCRERIVETEVQGLFVLPCGPRILNAGMLLSMPALADILEWAISEYDQVIVDCPPTLPVSDAAIVGRYVDGLLFLMNPDKTHRRSVARAVDQLRAMDLNIVGIVANTSLSDDRHSYGYQYGYGYGYGAEYSYGHDDELDDDSLTSGSPISDNNDLGRAA